MFVKSTDRERNFQTARLGCPLGGHSGLRVGEKPDSAGSQTPRHRRRHGAHGRADELVNKRIGNARVPATIHLIAGVDAAYRTDTRDVFSAVTLFDVDQMRVIETLVGESHYSFPYVPGLFSFREIPTISVALEKIKTPPDLVICDGHGVAHPRRFGLAAHLGVLYDLPSVGCAKTRLIGEPAMPAPERGASSPLVDRGEVVGSVLRTQAGVRPVYVSTGHRISLETTCA